MPQVDLDSLVTACTGGGVDRKIACETVVPEEEPDLTTEVQSDYPPGSFWLSKDAELDWFDRNAFLERNESTKANSISNVTVTVIQTSNSSSQQRISSNLKSLATIFGLPKTQKTTFVDPANRRFRNARLFPKQSGSMAKSAVVTVTEPSSPKVSCMGRVRSKRGIRPSSPVKSNGVAADQFPKSLSVRHQRNGICRCLFGIFRSNRAKEKDVLHEINNQQESSGDPKRKFPADPAPTPTPAAVSDPPGLGAMQRFASGRRSTASLGDES